jgi:hypothetical protein
VSGSVKNSIVFETKDIELSSVITESAHTCHSNSLAVSSLALSVFFTNSIVGLDVSHRFESKRLIQSQLKGESKVVDETFTFRMSATFRHLPFAGDDRLSDGQTTGINLGLAATIGSILLILFAVLIIWFFVKRRHQEEDAIPGDLETMEATEATGTYTEDIEDEPEFVNPISDENSIGSDAFDLDDNEGLSML